MPSVPPSNSPDHKQENPASAHRAAQLSLKELDRRSFCCHAGVEHVHPFDAKPFVKCEKLRCARCGREISRFEVINELGERIWPLPRGFSRKFVPCHRSLCISGGSDSEIRLPKALKSAIEG